MIILIPAIVGLTIGFIIGSLERKVKQEIREDEVENVRALKELGEKF